MVVTHETAPRARTPTGEDTLTGMAPTPHGELLSSSPSDALRNTTSLESPVHPHMHLQLSGCIAEVTPYVQLLYKSSTKLTP